MTLKRTTILHTISYYMIQIPPLTIIPISTDTVNPLSVLLVGLLINGLLYILNIFMLFHTKKSAQQNTDKYQELYHSMLIIKIATIPFFILNFTLYSGIIGMLFFSIILTGSSLVLLLIGVCITFCYLCTTSTYSIMAIYCAYKNQYITKRKYILYILAQLIFCVDILIAVIAYIEIDKKSKFKTIIE